MGGGGNNSNENLPGLGNEQPAGGQKKNLQIGDLVAANIGELNIGPGAHEWIVGTVFRYIPATDEYDIVDADDDTNKNNPNNKNIARGNKKGGTKKHEENWRQRIERNHLPVIRESVRHCAPENRKSVSRRYKFRRRCVRLSSLPSNDHFL